MTYVVVFGPAFPFQQEKHAKICQKTATKRRKVFDSSRQRAEGTDIPVLKPIKPKVSGQPDQVTEILPMTGFSLKYPEFDPLK